MSQDCTELGPDHWDRVRDEVGDHCVRADRDPSSLRIVAVTKGFPGTVVSRAVRGGLRHIGESYVQEFLDKAEGLAGDLADEVHWHMIGHLQSNKVRRILGRFDLVHSIDRPSVVQEFAKRMEKSASLQRVLVQVNVSGEDSKHGVDPAGTPELVDLVLENECLELRGFMTIAPLTDDESTLRSTFRRCRRIRDEMEERFDRSFPELSMGMTNDYPQAIREGATILRLGRKLFGERPASNPP